MSSKFAPLTGTGRCQVILFCQKGIRSLKLTNCRKEWLSLVGQVGSVLERSLSNPEVSSLNLIRTLIYSYIYIGVRLIGLQIHSLSSCSTRDAQRHSGLKHVCLFLKSKIEASVHYLCCVSNWNLFISFNLYSSRKITSSVCQLNWLAYKCP